MKKRSIWLLAAACAAFPGALASQSGPPRVLVYSDNPVISKGLKNQGVYANGTAYLRNDVVLVSGVWYVSAVDGNLGNPPAASPTKWLGFSVNGTGTQGPQGLQGLPGAAGAQGPQGLQGPAGIQGPQGLPGPAGVQGPQGLTGAAGPAGSAGAQGPAGASGVAGAAGPAGPVGLQGVPGVPGSGSSPGSAMADLAATNGQNGIANLVAGPCAAGTCDIMISPAYSKTEVSQYFTIAKDGNDEAYSRVPTLGGMGLPRFAEDHRQANRYLQSTNPIPLESYDLIDRTPFVFETRITNSYSYGDNTGTALFRLRDSGGTGNYNSSSVVGKKNFLALALDVIERGAGQGGGMSSSTLIHTAHGDDIVNVVQHDTNGCSEGEDECMKLWRAFLQTMVGRFGGTLKAAPTVDSAGFGNYSLDVNAVGGYDLSKAGERMFLVNLQNPYTAGNVTGILSSSYPGFARITGDAAANWATQFGTSAITSLVSAIDAKTYSTSCPSAVTSSSNQEPSPFITDENGIGGVTGFCATVASTVNISAGQACTLAGTHSNLEMVKVVSIVDGTHLRLNVQNPHDPNEYLSCGGAQGYGLSMTIDDIAPNGLFNYAFQPKTTLHKFFPILGSLSDGSLLAYTNEARATDFSTKAYATTTPQANAIISSISTSGTAVTAVNLSSAGNYQVGGSMYSVNTASGVLAAPTLTWSGCTLPPTTVNTLVFGLGTSAYGQGLSIAVTDGGNCSSPSATLSTTWPQAYRIAPLVMTKKVIDSSGSVTSGHLLVGDLNPARWHTGDLVEIPGWIHDYNWNLQSFGKYFTGSSNTAGIAHITPFNGNWAAPDILQGVSNTTDGHFYWATASQPIGAGIAYEQPPVLFGGRGNFSIYYQLGYTPQTAVFDIGCTWFGAFGTAPYHPCQDGKPNAYNLFQMHSTPGENNFLRYDNTLAGVLQGLLSWTRIFQATSFINTRGTPASSSEACATGESWDDSSFHYHCVATNTIKRVLMSSF